MRRMERLLAWYQVGSSYGAVATLIVANLVPLVGVLWFGWDVWGILVIYWLENGIVGLFNILKMRRACGPDTPAPERADGRRPGVVGPTINGRPASGMGKAILILFFIVHYGMFWLVHGVFVLILPAFAMMNADGQPNFGTTLDPGAILFVLAGLVISHGVSYRLNYIGRGEYLRTTPEAQMFAPYGRLMVLHVTIIFGAIAIGFTGAPAAAVVILVLLKIALELGLHLAEHREPVPTVATTAAGAPEPVS
jgi:hypothetical protein